MKLWTLLSWPDESQDGRYTQARGWWFRLGRNGPGLSYKNVKTAGHHPLFSERYGRDRTIQVRVGPHILKLLRPLKKGVRQALRRVK